MRILAMLIGLTAVIALMATPVAARKNKGTFKGRFIVEWLKDGRNMRLLRRVVYTTPNGKKWIAPKGMITDGASIPRSLWSIIGAPFTGKYRKAAIIHDHYCDTKSRSWRKTHKVFFSASRAAGIGAIKAEVMYYAVYRFGPRWKRSRTIGDSSEIVFKPRVVQSEFKVMKAKIERGGVGLAEIERVSDRSLRSLSRSFID